LFKTKLLSILLSSIVITSYLVFSNTVVNAAEIIQLKQTKSTIYMDSNGAQQTGWIYSNGKWVYLRADGTLASEINVNNITIGKTGCVYSSIQEAINKVPNCAVTLIINPGTYYEHLKSIGKNISMQGTNKDTCIVRDDSGDYHNAPLTISGSGKISNLTFISTHNKADYKIPSYAVHCDANGAGTLIFSNCKLVSYQNSAVGIGLHQNQTLIFDNCEFRKISSYNANYNSGAFYCHNAQNSNVTNQHLIVKNSKITTNMGFALRIDDANTYSNGINSVMDIAFYNNTLSSDKKGESDNLINFRNKPLNGGISGQIKLVKDSSGNNVSSLNNSK